nr:reverse transcriptase domain-containing protein [Tanacetum cinerariifolium]
MKGRNRKCSKQRIVNSNLEEHSHLVVTMADQRTMAQFLQAPTKGYEDAIVILAITADNFELKHGLLTLVQNKQFYGLDKEDPHAHICYFNKITSTLKFPNVPNTSIKLILFPFSLEVLSTIQNNQSSRSSETRVRVSSLLCGKVFVLTCPMWVNHKTFNKPLGSLVVDRTDWSYGPREDDRKVPMQNLVTNCGGGLVNKLPICPIDLPLTVA